MTLMLLESTGQLPHGMFLLRAPYQEHTMLTRLITGNTNLVHSVNMESASPLHSITLVINNYLVRNKIFYLPIHFDPLVVASIDVRLQLLLLQCLPNGHF